MSASRWEASADAFVRAVGAARQERLRQGLLLEGFELGLVDRAAVEQLLGLLDVSGGAATAARRCADIVVHLLSLSLGPFEVALVHAVVLGDHVDEHAQERQDQREDEPTGLAATRQVAPAENVAPH